MSERKKTVDGRERSKDSSSSEYERKVESMGEVVERMGRV